MKLQVTFELPLPTETQPYLEMIASIFGHSSDLMPDVSPSDFVCKQICEPQVTALFRTLIGNALHAYLGMAGKTQVAAVLDQFDLTHNAKAEIVSD